jgi:glucan biosynthesis protein C
LRSYQSKVNDWLECQWLKITRLFIPFAQAVKWNLQGISFTAYSTLLLAKPTYTNDQRIYGIDALRGITMTLGIVLHASIAYKVISLPNWPFDNVYRSKAFDFCYQFIHSFRMPLFFMIAGFFSRMLLLKVGIPAFVRHRFKRIFLPFVFSIVLLLPFTAFPFIWFEYTKQNNEPLSKIWPAIARQSLRWNGLAHLWFLYYLVIFYGGYVVYYWILLHKPQKVSASAPSTSWLPHLLFAAALTAGLIACIHHSPGGVVGIDTSAFPQLRVVGYYFLFFAAGTYIHKHPAILQFFAQRHYWLIALGIAATIVFFQLLSGNFSVNHWVASGLSLFNTLLLTAGITGLFLVHFNVNNPLWKYLSDAAYWMYLIHLGIVGFLQVMLTHTTVPGPFRFLIVLLATLLLTLISYQWFVRYTRIGQMLHGERKKPLVQKDKGVNKAGK